jgi:hypothetical protein
MRGYRANKPRFRRQEVWRRFLRHLALAPVKYFDYVLIIRGLARVGLGGLFLGASSMAGLQFIIWAPGFAQFGSNFPRDFWLAALFFFASDLHRA